MIAKLKKSVRTNPKTSRKELVEEIASIGVNVTRHSDQCTANGKTSQVLSEEHYFSSVSKNHLPVKFATEMLSKEDKYFDKITCSNETRIQFF